MTHAPIKNNSTRYYEKTLVKGVGYITIYSSQREKFEMSTQGSSLRYTNRRNGRQVLYTRVESVARMKEIEHRSERWMVCGKCSDYGYYIMLQLNADGKFIGYIKVIEKSKASYSVFFNTVKADRETDWTYYERKSDIR